MGEQWTNLSALELARRIRSGEARSRDVVEAHIQRVEAVNPALNAVVAYRYDAARAEADAWDARRAAEGPEALPPLAGVPCTIKECFALRGMPNSSGLVARRDVVARSDATAVSRLRAAGAVPMGVTNTSELCMWMESRNRLYGTTNNPYDTSRIVGGSSGGEGAIVGSGASPFGLGSDVGGSIRMPAFFNGVFGHKPTGGMVPGTGQHPIAENEALRFLTTGPLCRRAEDLMPLLRILAGPDGRDTGCVAFDLGDPEAVDLSRLRVLVVESNGAHPLLGGRVEPALLDAQRAAADALADAGAAVESARVEGLERSLEIWSSMMSAADDKGFQASLFEGRPRARLRAELPRYLAGRSPHTLAALALCVLERAVAALGEDTQGPIEMGLRLKADLGARLGGDGVMLYPPYTRTAPRHRAPLLTPTDWVYTAIFNVLEFPVTQVPMGLDAQGLPLGVQVAAAPGNDHLSIAVARALERAAGGWVPPTVPQGPPRRAKIPGQRLRRAR